MKRISLFLFIAAMFSACKQMPDSPIAFQNEIEIYPSNAPELEANGCSIEQSDSVHCWDVFCPTLTIYVPAQPTGQAILCTPGGSYAAVWYGTEGRNYAEWLNAQGITLAVLKYRMPNGHKNIPLEDVRKAMTLMRMHSEEWHVEQLGVMGFSAGGHLASTAATHWTDSCFRPDFQVLFYPVITMDTSFTHMESRKWLLGENPTAEDVSAYSNELRVTAETPAAFVVWSEDDGLVPPQNSEAYCNALRAAGVSCTALSLPFGGHGWSGHPEFALNGVWMSALSEWLKTVRK